MVRLGSVALIAISLPAAAWSSPPASDRISKKAHSFHMPRPADEFAPASDFGKAEIAPNMRVGFGVFGMKSERGHLRPATVQEINSPKQRRAAVGFSMQF